MIQVKCQCSERHGQATPTASHAATAEEQGQVVLAFLDDGVRRLLLGEEYPLVVTVAGTGNLPHKPYRSFSITCLKEGATQFILNWDEREGFDLTVGDGVVMDIRTGRKC